jgi:hypothetical protein
MEAFLTVFLLVPSVALFWPIASVRQRRHLLR